MSKLIDDLWNEKKSIRDYARQKKSEVIKAYVWIRENNSSIPDDILDLMKDAALSSIAGLCYDEED